MSAEATAAQYRLEGIADRTIRDAPPVPVHLIWRAQDAHPLTPAVVALAIDLYRDSLALALGRGRVAPPRRRTRTAGRLAALPRG